MVSAVVRVVADATGLVLRGRSGEARELLKSVIEALGQPSTGAAASR
jgi:hypothetical protein